MRNGAGRFGAELERREEDVVIAEILLVVDLCGGPWNGWSNPSSCRSGNDGDSFGGVDLESHLHHPQFPTVVVTVPPSHHAE